MTLESDHAGKGQEAREASGHFHTWCPGLWCAWRSLDAECLHSFLELRCHCPQGGISDAPGPRFSYWDMTLCSATRTMCLTLGHRGRGQTHAQSRCRPQKGDKPRAPLT